MDLRVEGRTRRERRGEREREGELAGFGGETERWVWIVRGKITCCLLDFWTKHSVTK